MDTSIFNFGGFHGAPVTIGGSVDTSDTADTASL